MFDRLLYVSHASTHLSPRDVYDIIRGAHNRNSRFGLTGGLLYMDGQFVQVLEGEAFRLRQRFAVIAADPRHRDVQVRYSATALERLFPDDWMALRLQGEIDPQVLTALGYQAGLPAEQFDGSALVELVQACCATARQSTLNA